MHASRVSTSRRRSFETSRGGALRKVASVTWMQRKRTTGMALKGLGDRNHSTPGRGPCVAPGTAMRNEVLSCRRRAARLAPDLRACVRPRITARAALMLPFAWVCAACSGLAGTPPGVKHTLAEIKGDPSFSIEIAPPDTGSNLGFLPLDDGGTGPSSVTLGTWSHGGANVCPVLGQETVATLNGTVMSTISLGWFGGDICQVAQWT